MERVHYPHEYIWSNGRSVRTGDIVAGRVRPFSDAEANAFTFIREWLTGSEQFALKTSGSTGQPKQLIATRSQMAAAAALSAEALQLVAGWNALLCIDAAYIGGKMMIVRGIAMKMKLFIVDPCAHPLRQIPVDQTIHFAAFVPYQVSSILESKHPHLLDAVTTCIIGGAPLDDSTYIKVAASTMTAYLTYGMTETLSHIALHRISTAGVNRVYRTLPGIRISTDDRGCLVIEAAYLGAPVITNDVVEIINTGEFVWKGRYDNVINSGGVKLSPELVEAKVGKIFTRLNLRNRFFIHHAPDAKLGQRAVLVMEGPAPAPSVVNVLRDTMSQELHPYEVPKDLYQTSSFDLTPTGKINRVVTMSKARQLSPARD